MLISAKNQLKASKITNKFKRFKKFKFLSFSSIYVSFILIIEY